MGMLYKQKGSGKWWMKYYVDGRPIRESTETDNWEEAKTCLKQREGKAAEGQPILPRARRVRVEELLNDLRVEYQTSGRRTLREADTRFVPLKAFFTRRRVSTLNGAVFTEYIQRRQAAGVANGTINRELSMLGTALRFGEENSKVLRRPIIHLLKEADARQGFFERDQFLSVRKRLAEDLQVVVTIAYTFGWRMQSEVLRLPLTAVDLDEGTLRLEPGMTKNRKGRTVYLTPELRGLVAEQIERVKGLSRKLHRVIPYLFPHLHGGYKGTQRRDFRVAWGTACQAVGLVGALKHDLRRTAVRNLVNSGVPEYVAMKITGHKTRSVFDRYSIVSPAELLEATRKLHGHSIGHSAQVPVDSRSITVQNR